MAVLSVAVASIRYGHIVTVGASGRRTVHMVRASETVHVGCRTRQL